MISLLIKVVQKNEIDLETISTVFFVTHDAIGVIGEHRAECINTN